MWLFIVVKYNNIKYYRLRYIFSQFNSMLKLKGNIQNERLYTECQTYSYLSDRIGCLGEKESTVRKKMAVVHLTTIPCEPNRAISTHRKLYFVLAKLCMQGLKFSDLFFLAVLGFFAIFFYTVD